MTGALDHDIAAVQRIVLQTAWLLDDEKLADWIALFDADGAYEITSYSPELQRWTPWWSQPLELLRKTVSEVPRHVRDPAKRLHVLSLPMVEVSGDAARSETPFALYRTLPTGESSLYMVGTYHDDQRRFGDGSWRYVRHCARAHTRMLDAFTHLPV